MKRFFWILIAASIIAFVAHSQISTPGSGVNKITGSEYIYSGQKTFIEGENTYYVQISMPPGNWCSVDILFSYSAYDGTVLQLGTDRVNYSLINSGGTVLYNGTVYASTNVSSDGSSAVGISGYSVDDNSSPIFKLGATIDSTSLNLPGPTVINVKWQLRINTDAPISVTPL